MMMSACIRFVFNNITVKARAVRNTVGDVLNRLMKHKKDLFKVIISIIKQPINY